MTKNEIINQLAEERTVEKLIQKITKRADEELKDLAQDIYLNLLEKKEDKIEKIYEKGEMEYFIIGMIQNNVFSKTSPYYTMYKRYNINKESLQYDENGEEKYSEHNGNLTDI